jgi:hypothetical protein
MVDEQKEEKTEGVEEKTTNANPNVRISTKEEIDVLEEAKKVTDEMKRQNEEKRKLLDREEKLLARQETLRALGGGSPAGQKPVVKEETPKEYADRILGGKPQK